MINGCKGGPTPLSAAVKSSDGGLTASVAVGPPKLWHAAAAIT